MKQIKALFKGERPFVKTFYEKIAHLSQEEKDEYIRMAYKWALTDWKSTNKTYREFLINLIESDWQRFLDFVHEETVMGALRYPLKEPETFLKLLHITEGNIKDRNSSLIHLAFCLISTFKIKLKINSLRNKLRNQSFTPEEVLDVYAKAQIDDMQKQKEAEKQLNK